MTIGREGQDVAFRSGSAVAVGTNAEIPHYASPGTRTVRLDGATVGQRRLSLQNHLDGLRHVRVFDTIRNGHERKNPRRMAAPIRRGQQGRPDSRGPTKMRRGAN